MGTIPCALILLMVNPIHAVAFVIIVIIAQQVDSNLIYPVWWERLWDCLPSGCCSPSPWAAVCSASSA